MEVATRIFLWAHSCEQDNHKHLVQYCCVSSQWRAVLYAIPKLWYCIARATGQSNTDQALAHISRAINQPLHISFRVSLNDIGIRAFLPLLKKYCHRWRRIDIFAIQFPLIKKVLEFTTTSQLHLLEHLVVHKEPPTLHYVPIQDIFLTRAPRLATLVASSYLFVHLPQLTTLVDVTLRPCYATSHMLKALASNPIEKLQLGLCSWDSSIFSSPPIHFQILLQLTVDGIDWFTLWGLLDILTAPRLRTLDLTLELDQYTRAIDLEDSINLYHHMHSVTHLSITALCINSPTDYVSAIVFLFGWKFPSVTCLTTNLPIDYLCALQTSAHNAHFPDEFEALGFTLPNIASVPQSIPAILFPRLIDLRCSDTSLQYSPRALHLIAKFRRDMCCPLDSITCHFEKLSVVNLSLLESLVGELHNWTDDEVDFQDGEGGYRA